jgi:hypothetical protein
VFIGHVYSEDIESLADTAVEAHVFAFLSETVIKSCLFQQEVIRKKSNLKKVYFSDLGIFNSTFSYAFCGFYLLFTV